MKKFFLNVFGVLFFLIFFSFVFSQKSVAANCTFNLTPSPITDKTSSFTVNVTSADFALLHSYTIQVSGGNACYHNYCPNRSAQPTNGSVSVKFDLPNTLSNGSYSVSVIDSQGGGSVCSSSFQVGQGGGKEGTSCTVNFTNEKCANSTGCFKPSDYISTYITGDLANNGNADDMLRVYVKTDKGNTVWNGCVKRGALVDSRGFGLGYLTTGNYSLQVSDKCNTSVLFFWNTENLACNANFTIDPNGGGINGKGTSDNPIPPLSPCSNGANESGTCKRIDTGFGFSVGTDPISLIQSLFGIILSVSGGIALLLIVVSGYRLMISQGNPEAIKGAREQLTAAIVGLLFIIFALVILQIIGVDVLHIPGFSSSGTQTFNAGAR